MLTMVVVTSTLIKFEKRLVKGGWNEENARFYCCCIAIIFLWHMLVVKPNEVK